MSDTVIIQLIVGILGLVSTIATAGIAAWAAVMLAKVKAGQVSLEVAQATRAEAVAIQVDKVKDALAHTTSGTDAKLADLKVVALATHDATDKVLTHVNAATGSITPAPT